jgi:hypothetical protein
MVGVLCFILVRAQRVINLLVPGQIGHIADRLSHISLVSFCLVRLSNLDALRPS